MRRTYRSGRPLAVPAPGAPRHLLSRLALLALGACGGGGDARAGDSSSAWLANAKKSAARDGTPVVCGPGTAQAVTLAVTEFVKTAQPKPQRFLYSVGTDSALPDPGIRALQDHGPTYLFPGAPELQATVRAQLHDKGDYTTMLVVLREATRQDSTVAVRVHGHYIGGEEDGRSTGPRRLVAACSAGKWRIAGAAAEKSA
jgi:hypothetical protein